MKPTIKIIVAEGCQYMRGGVIERLIKPQSQLQLVGEAESQQQVIELYNRFKPELLILALNRPDAELPQRIAQINQLCSELNILILTSCKEGTTVRATMKAGATGYVLSSESTSMILDAIHQVAMGASWISPCLGYLLATSQPTVKSASIRSLKTVG